MKVQFLMAVLFGMVGKFFLILMACASLNLVAADQRRVGTPVVDLETNMFGLSGYGSGVDAFAAWHVGAQVAAQAQGLLQASAGAGAGTGVGAASRSASNNDLYICMSDRSGGPLGGELIDVDIFTAQDLLPSGLLSPDDQPRFLSPSDRLAAAVRGQAPRLNQLSAGAGAAVGVGSAVVEREVEELGPIRDWGDTDIFAITTPEDKEAFQKRLSYFQSSNPVGYAAYKDVMVQRRAPGLNPVSADAGARAGTLLSRNLDSNRRRKVGCFIETDKTATGLQ